MRRQLKRNLSGAVEAALIARRHEALPNDRDRLSETVGDAGYATPRNGVLDFYFLLGRPVRALPRRSARSPVPVLCRTTPATFCTKRGGYDNTNALGAPVWLQASPRGHSPKENRAPEEARRKVCGGHSQTKRGLLNRGSFAHGHGRGLAGLEHGAMGLEARGGAGVVGHARGDADQDHGDRCNKRHSHDLQVGRAISGDKRMIHGISPRFLSVGRATRGFGSLSNADSSQKFRVDCCALADALPAKAANAVYVID